MSQTSKPEVKNPALLRKWVESLESGDYPQGTGWLRMDGHYCCLGVLADLALKDGVVEGHWQEVYTAKGETSTSYLIIDDDPLAERHDQELPRVLYELVGLGSAHGEIMVNDYETAKFRFPEATFAVKSLAEANDNGATFAAIAGMLREYLPVETDV